LNRSGRPVPWQYETLGSILEGKPHGEALRSGNTLQVRHTCTAALRIGNARYGARSNQFKQCVDALLRACPERSILE
jgi:hypothetical protein